MRRAIARWTLAKADVATDGRASVPAHERWSQRFVSQSGCPHRSGMLGSVVRSLAPPPTPSIDDARDFLALLLGGHVARARGVGLGESLGFAFGDLAGTRVAVDA